MWSTAEIARFYGEGLLPIGSDIQICIFEKLIAGRLDCVLKQSIQCCITTMENDRRWPNAAKREVLVRWIFMTRILLAIFAGAVVTILGYFLLASAILPSGVDDPIPPDVVSDDAGPHSEFTPRARAKVLLQKHEMRESKCAPIEAHLQELLHKSRDCEINSDCVVVNLGCPFGCVDAYSKSAESVIIKEAKAYQTRCHSCVYTCPACDQLA